MDTQIIYRKVPVVILLHHSQNDLGFDGYSLLVEDGEENIAGRRSIGFEVSVYRVIFGVTLYIFSGFLGRSLMIG